jgi:hypothetical protein
MLAAGRGLGPDAIHMPEPAQDGLAPRDSVERHPLSTGRIRNVGELAVPYVPAAKDEVEVAAAVRTVSRWNAAAHTRSSLRGQVRCECLPHPAGQIIRLNAWSSLACNGRLIAQNEPASTGCIRQVLRRICARGLGRRGQIAGEIPSSSTTPVRRGPPPGEPGSFPRRRSSRAGHTEGRPGDDHLDAPGTQPGASDMATSGRRSNSGALPCPQ